MLPPLFDISLIADYLVENTFIITPNRRLTAQIQAAYTAYQLQQKKAAWQAPVVSPIEDWIKSCWQSLLISGHPAPLKLHVLSKNQELLLWEQAIRRDRESALLKPYATAKSALSAYRLLELWHASIGPSFNEHPDCARFAYWARQFEQHCQQLGYITAGKMTAIVADAFAEGRLTPPRRLIPTGFQQMPPAFSSLLERTGTEIIEPIAETPAATTCAHPCQNAEQELQMAALWSKRQLEENPQQRIGIVVPDLKQRRAQVERIFTNTYEPQTILPNTLRYHPPFNISAGNELNRMPVIQDALNILKLNQAQIEVQDIFRLLRSPFLLQQAHWHASLFELEARIKQEGRTQLTLNQLQQHLEDQAGCDSALQAWRRALSDILQLSTHHRTKKTAFAGWVKVFKQQIDAFHWPGQRRLDSMEYQQVKRWQAALDELTEDSELITQVRGEIGLEDALALLNRSIASIEFQAESPAPSPLQILGMLEGGGLRFDALWIMGVNDHNWPPQPNPNPFIPIKLQRALNMPHASPERELAFTQSLFQEYLCSASTVVASYSLSDQDQPLAPSHLIEQFPDSDDDIGTLEKPEFPHSYYRHIKNAEQTEYFRDTRAPSLANNTEVLRGGTQILKDQASCPFKAFAVHRLGLRQIQEASDHILASHRGNMLHRALELIWQQIKDFDTLCVAEKGQLMQWIDTAVSRAVKSQARLRPELFNPRMIELEHGRLAELLSRWLQVEKQRTAFQVVATESASSIGIAGQTLKVRIDRIDRLEDGSLAIIDYKSGLCSTNQWQGERLEEPQLPLYCVTFDGLQLDGEINALAFAQINVDRQGFIGIAAQPNVAPDISTPETIRNWAMNENWMDLKAQWRQSLEKLMHEFIEGHANVDPRQSGSCQYCHLPTLCRIHDPRCFKGHN